jgi:hypothetical protein
MPDNAKMRDVIATVHACAGPPVCLLEGDAAEQNMKDGCHHCRRINIHADGSETEFKLRAQ